MELERQDHLLDHSYDDIQEYDNPLPKWWVGLFWATIILTPCYIVYYHWGVGPSIYDDYNAAAVDHLERQNALFAEMDITDELIAEKMSDPTLMGGMQALFESKCATCHGNNAAGLACPNLTDDYWIHGGGLVDIFTVIRDGVAGKEMKSWKDELGPARLVAMAAYIGTLRGTNVPGGKGPEGEEYKPE